MKPVVYKLRYPVEIQDGDQTKTITEVTIQRMKGKHRLAAAQAMRDRGVDKPNDWELGLFAIAQTVGLPISVFVEFDDEDLENIAALRAGGDNANFPKTKSVSSSSP